MNELIQEIQEDIRRERFERLWQSLGKIMVGVSIMVILATIGFQVFQYEKRMDATEHTSVFLQGMDRLNMQDYKGAVEKFSAFANDPTSPYHGLFMLRKAQAQSSLSQNDAAAKTYADLARQDPVFGKLAEVLGDANDAKQVTPAPQPSEPKPSEPFYFTRSEARGWQLWKQGKKDEAISQFLTLYNDPSVPHTMRGRLGEILRHVAADKMPVDVQASQGGIHE